MIEYRRPQQKEARDIIALVHHMVTTAFPMFPQAAIAFYLQPWAHAKLAGRIDGSHDLLIAAFDAGKLAGIVSGTAAEGGVGTIVWLLVADSHRGKGVGRRLLDEAKKTYRAMGAHKIKLTSPSGEATAFYEHCGMKVEGVHMNHWWKLDFTALGMDL